MSQNRPETSPAAEPFLTDPIKPPPPFLCQQPGQVVTVNGVVPSKIDTVETKNAVSPSQQRRRPWVKRAGK